jgi:cytochrome P450/NADPH-cytochrome P450 reductase
MAPKVRDTCERIYQEATGASEAEAEAWIDAVERTHGRYVADIFT